MRCLSERLLPLISACSVASGPTECAASRGRFIQAEGHRASLGLRYAHHPSSRGRGWPRCSNKTLLSRQLFSPARCGAFHRPLRKQPCQYRPGAAAAPPLTCAGAPDTLANTAPAILHLAASTAQSRADSLSPAAVPVLKKTFLDLSGSAGASSELSSVAGVFSRLVDGGGQPGATGGRGLTASAVLKGLRWMVADGGWRTEGCLPPKEMVLVAFWEAVLEVALSAIAIYNVPATCVWRLREVVAPGDGSSGTATSSSIAHVAASFDLEPDGRTAKRPRLNARSSLAAIGTTDFTGGAEEEQQPALRASPLPVPSAVSSGESRISGARGQDVLALVMCLGRWGQLTALIKAAERELPAAREALANLREETGALAAQLSSRATAATQAVLQNAAGRTPEEVDRDLDFQEDEEDD